MGLLKDIVDTINDSVVGDLADTAMRNLSQKSYSSIQQRANEGTLQFPHIVSRGLDLPTAQMVLKASERNHATFVQIAMSLSPNLYIEDGKDAAAYVRQFHSNLSGLNMKSIKSDLLSIAVENGYLGFLERDGMLAVTTTLNDTTKTLNVTNREQLYSVLDDLNTKILNQPVQEVKIINMDRFEKTSVVTEAPNGGYRRPNARGRDFRVDTTGSKSTIINNPINIDNKSPRVTVSPNININNPAPKASDKPVVKDVRLNDKMLLDNDVKKANELVSTLVHVRIQLVSKEHGTTLGYHDFILGVKATMHLATPNEMTENLMRAYRGSSGFFDFIRWTTGEINFIRDLILQVNTIKKDVLTRTAGSSPIWLSAKRAKRLAGINNFFSKTRMLPNVTIVITREEVDYIKEVHGVDFFNLGNVNIVMEQLYLLSFIIVDSANEVVHFKYEAADDWEAVSFSGLEKSNEQDQRKFKEMLKTLNR